MSVGDNTASSLFVAGRNVYHTTTAGENYSYVDVRLSARRYIGETRTEQVEIFSTYDENKKTYSGVTHADTPLELLNAYRARAKHIGTLIK